MFSKAIIATTLLSVASAHQNWHQLWVNDVTPGYQVGIRMPPSNSPVTDVTSNDMACNVGGSKVPSGVKTVDAKEGDSIKVQWDSSGHPGPITHWLFGPVDDASQATGIGAGWVKIDEMDYKGGKWASEIMQANNMTYQFKLPQSLKAGQYLLRSEMLALHAAQTLGGGQFYIGCAQLKIAGTGSGSCSPSISLPGAYKASDKDIYIPNYYNGYDPTTYAAPGGPVATCGGSGGSAPAASQPAPSATPTAAAPAQSSAAAPAASSPAASQSAAAESAAPVPSATPSSSPAPSTGNGNGNGSGQNGGALPESFTISTFIAWLQSQAGSAKARRHARDF